MLTIDEDNVIYLTRGDTAYLTLAITFQDESYEMQEGDKLILSVKKKVSDTDYAFQIASDSLTIPVYPQDTKELDYGKYFYDIELDTAKGEVFTLFEKNVFKIQEEVTL